jgi:ELWxxDGT repeat protein
MPCILFEARIEPATCGRAILAALATSVALTIPVAWAAPIPAQPATDIRPSTKNDPNGDANPFHLTQVEEKLFFIAETDRGPALYVRDIANTEVDGEPVIEMVGRKLRPKLVKHFRKDQEFDNQIVGADMEFLGSTGPVTLNGGLYFHVPGFGLFASRGTRGTTKLIAKVDKKDEPDTWMTGLIYVPQAGSTTHQLLFAALDRGKGSKGRELFTSRAKVDDTSSSPVFDKKHTGIFSDILDGSESSDPKDIVASLNQVYFTAISAVTNTREIFLSEDNGVPTPVSENLGFAQGLATNGDSCVFAGPSTVNGETDVYAATSTGTTKSTTDGVSPRHIISTGLQYLFSGRMGSTGRELGRVDGFDFTVDPVADINPGPGSSDPDQFLAIDGGGAFLTAFDGTARRLYITGGPAGVELIRASDGSLLTVDATHEKVIIRGTLYFTATKAGESVPWLWRLEEFTLNAIRVNTPAGFPVTGATNLFEYKGASRLYFSCDGTGTEFVTEDAEDKRLRPRGRELWVTAE